MPSQDDAFARHQRGRWTRENAALWVRPDIARFLPPRDERKTQAEPAPGRPYDDAREIIIARYELSWLRLQAALLRSAITGRKYSADQPRVPAGNPDGGQWTDADGGWGDAQAQAAAARAEAEQQSRRSYDDRLASNDKLPELRRASRWTLIFEAGRKIVELHRSENFLVDLFGNRDRNTVAHTNLDGEDIFGTNSTSPLYYPEDREAADRMRDVLMERYPETMRSDNSGQMPNNALYHAETNALLRRAKKSGGSLEGQSVDIYVDGRLCLSCRQTVPLVGVELGNPEITIVDPFETFIIRDGKIISRSKR